jgi:hypothetical protein
MNNRQVKRMRKEAKKLLKEQYTLQAKSMITKDIENTVKSLEKQSYKHARQRDVAILLNIILSCGIIFILFYVLKCR